MNILKYNTSATVKMGPFVSSADGYTEQTSLTLSQADFRLSKNGGNMAQKNDTGSGTHDEVGWYDVDLNTTDTNGLGRLDIAVSEAGSLPVWATFMVMSEQEYDSFFGSGVLATSATNLSEVDVGIVEANLTEIDSISLSGHDAVLRLNQLSLKSSTVIPFRAESLGPNDAMYAKGYGKGSGFNIHGGVTAPALNLYGGTNGLKIESLGVNTGLLINSPDVGVEVIGDKGGIYVKAVSNGHALGLSGHPGTGHGIDAYGNAGIYARGVAGLGYGMVLSGIGAGQAGLLTNGAVGMVASATNLDEVSVSVDISTLATSAVLDTVGSNVQGIHDVLPGGGQDMVGNLELNAVWQHVDDVYIDMATSAVLDTVGSNVLLIPIDNNGITVSANNLSEVDINGQTTSANNLSEVDVSGQVTSANNLSEVDVSGQSVSANNLSEVDVSGQTVFASATNLSEVDVSGQSVSATNLSEVDINGQVTSASNLSEIDLSILATSAAIQVVDNNIDTIVGVLPAGGDIIAGQNDIDAILVNTRFKATVPSQAIVPETGYYPYELIAHLYNSSGSMEDPDLDKMYIQIKAVSGAEYKNELYDDVGTTTHATSGINSNFQPEYYEMTKVNTGYYHIFYKLSANEDSNQWVATFGYEENGEILYHSRTTIILTQTAGVTTLADNITNKDIIRESMGRVDGAEASIDTKLNNIYGDMGTSARQVTINTNVVANGLNIGLIPTDNNGISVSANNLDEIDFTGLSVSANNLDEVDINGQTVFASATNLSEVDVSGQSVSANNLDEIDFTGLSVSASNLSEVDVSGQSVSANNLDEIGLTGLTVSASNLSEVDINGQTTSASNLSEVDVSGQSVSANNLDEIDFTGLSVSANNLDEVDISGQTTSASNLSEVDINGQTTSASNLSEVDVSGQTVFASATNLSEVDINGQTTSANNLDEIGLTGLTVSASNLSEVDVSGQSVSASNLSELNVSADCYTALTGYGVHTSAYADVIRDQLLVEINDVANEVMLSATIDGSKNLTQVMSDLLAEAIGKIVFTSASDLFTYYRQDNITSAFALSGTNDLRTRI